MSDPPPRRRLHLLVPSADAGSVLVTEDAHLPVMDLDLAPGETTVSGARRAMRERFGLDRPVTELTFDPAAGSAPPGATVVALIGVEPAPSEWAPPSPWRWAALRDPDPTTDAALAPRLRRLLAERRGEQPIPPQRPPWCQAGWYDHAARWIERSLEANGSAPAQSIVQHRHWGISALMRVETGDGTCWFKAASAHFNPEARHTAWLSEVAPGAVPPVVASDADEGWLLLGDVGSDSFDARLDDPEAAITTLVSMQRRLHVARDELLARGLPDRRLPRLPQELARAISRPEIERLVTLPRSRLDQLVGWLGDAVPIVDALGLPDTIVHGDFHPGNAVLDDGRVVIMDWSDIAVSHPLVDAATWMWWSDDDEAQRSRAWSVFTRAWDDVVPAATLDAHRHTIEATAAAYHCVSYADLLASVEPDHHADLDGLTSFLTKLDRLAPS
jgi:hypothetical protein